MEHDNILLLLECTYQMVASSWLVGPYKGIFKSTVSQRSLTHHRVTIIVTSGRRAVAVFATIVAEQKTLKLKPQTVTSLLPPLSAHHLA